MLGQPLDSTHSSSVFTLDNAFLDTNTVTKGILYDVKVLVEIITNLAAEVIEHQEAILLHALVLQVLQDPAGYGSAPPTSGGGLPLGHDYPMSIQRIRFGVSFYMVSSTILRRE